MTAPKEFSELIEAKGHLIDSRLLNSIFDKVIEKDAKFEVLQFDIGRTNEDYSHVKLKITAGDAESLRRLVEELMPLGCHPQPDRNAKLIEADADGVAPDFFYSTTNHQTHIRYQDEWLTVLNQRMDGVIVVSKSVATCQKLRDLKRGQLVVCGVDGIRVSPEFTERDRHGFAFMTNDVSTERRVEVSASKVVGMMRHVKQSGGKIVFVAGPVVVHSGGVTYLTNLIKQGYVDALLAGNALAVHDVEHALYGTSLGVDLEDGAAVEEGHQNHMRAINSIRRAGSLPQAVADGVISKGIMHELICNNIPFVLAGSIRDDGPLPDTVMDLIEAQDQYADLLSGASMVIMLSTMLHSIGVGNMLPSNVRVVCVDINPTVVTKLGDRGSSQTLGIVTDVGLFLHQLSTQLSNLESTHGSSGSLNETKDSAG